MAKATPAKPRKPPATAKTPAAGTSTPPKAKQWRVDPETPEEVAAHIDASLTTKLGNVQAAKERKKAAGINKVVAPAKKSAGKSGKTPEKVKSQQKNPPPAPVGAPTKFTQQLADLICEALAEGHSLRNICADDKFPSKATVFRWLADDDHKDFRDQYARAREAQADCLFDDMLDIADDGRNDTYVDDDGMRKTDFDVIARSKLRLDTRKWMAGKLRPKVYGDKVDLNHGVQPDNPMLSLLAQVGGTALTIVPSGEE